MRRLMELDEVADGILDGSVIDWSNVDADAALVEQLKTLQTLRLARRARALPDPPGPWNWGHLKVLERIGLGAYGDVYRAWDSRLDREVALKLLPVDEPGDATSTIIEEGRLLARVRHPNVVTIYGAERIGGRAGLWMELVKGQTLEEALRSGRTFGAAEVAKLGVELCSAVSAVHAAGLLHRDIKAQNVMLDDSGRLVLMDFGTGHEVSDASNAQVAGTPLYLAPEVLAGNAATPQSDVYSIGVVLFHLLTNSYPVAGKSIADLRRAHESGGAAGASLDQVQLPARLRRVIARALDSRPDHRHDSPASFRDALIRSVPTLSPRRWVMLIASALAVVTAIALAWNPMAAPVKPVPSIAVLPFTNAGSEPGTEDFIDGLTSEVIRNLAMIDGLEVRSQTSSFSFKGRPRNLDDVGRQLRVNHVVEATVQRLGNRLRVNAQLVPVNADAPLWSKSFDRTIDDVFEIQDEISLAIVNELRLTLGSGQRRYKTNTPAYDLYLRGLNLVEQGGGTQRATEASKLFLQVIALDSQFAPAHAGLAAAYAGMSWQPDGLTDGEGIAAMRPAAMRALELDPLLPEAHAAMGITYARERDWENARKSFEEALRLPPFSSQSLIMYAASTLFQVGEAARAEALLTDALARDPLSLAVRRELAIAQFVQGRFDDAVENFQAIRSVDPKFGGGSHNLLARALMHGGRPEEAIKLYDSNPANKAWERWLLPAYIAVGRTADRDRVIAENINEIPHRQAIIYAALKEKEKTIDAFGRAIDVNPQRVAFMLASPDFAFLRGDPGYDALRKRLNLLR